MARLKVIRPGMLTTVQDLGRQGWGYLGVSQQGALDPYALRWANRLAGNGSRAAALEITLLGPTLEVLEACFGGFAGAELGLKVNGEPWPAGTSRGLEAGDTLFFGPPKDGMRAYLAFAGGVQGEELLGSRSTDLPSRVGGFAGRALRAGDIVTVGDLAGNPAVAPVPTAILGNRVRLLAGPRDGLFAPDALHRLTSGPYLVTSHSDRAGMRLSGPEILGAPGGILSEGTPLGGVEIPPSGQPIVLLQGRGSVGGYPILATVISADIPVLAQIRPGSSLSFEEVSRDVARQARREMERSLDLGLRPLR